MSTENQIAVQQPQVMASTQLAAFLGIEKNMMIDTVKRQCFKGLSPDQVTDAQLASFISVAAQFKVNPMLPGFLYCYPERNGGIQVMIGPDLMFKLLDENPGIDSWETEVFPADVSLPPTHAVTKIYRKGKERPITYTAVLSEWRVSANPNWASRPRHMLGIRSLKQAARQIVHGLPFDEDERKIAEMQNVTGTAEESANETPPVTRAPVRERAKKGAAAVAEVVVPAEVPDIRQAMQAREEKTKTVETPAKQEPAPKQADPAPGVDPAPDPAPAIQPRAFLKPDERGEFNVEVVSVEPVVAINVKQPDGSAKKTPTIEATVKGDFNGLVRHYDGATWNDKTEKDATALPCWKPGTLLTLSLWGRALSTGKVRPQVESVKPQVVTEEE